jgi:alkanesulfonate monooxygenase SsuD/methylene tetrahydromethanopterin reductase-like flavin-dependent oxidoreductase (luciferase family)
MERLGRDEAAARDTLLAGTVGAIQDKLVRLRAAGVGMLFLPTFFLPRDPRPQLDRFMERVIPAFRK